MPTRNRFLWVLPCQLPLLPPDENNRFVVKSICFSGNASADEWNEDDLHVLDEIGQVLHVFLIVEKQEETETINYQEYAKNRRATLSGDFELLLTSPS